jgi:hypothetical protein
MKLSHLHEVAAIGTADKCYQCGSTGGQQSFTDWWCDNPQCPNWNPKMFPAPDVTGKLIVRIGSYHGKVKALDPDSAAHAVWSNILTDPGKSHRGHQLSQLRIGVVPATKPVDPDTLADWDNYEKYREGQEITFYPPPYLGDVADELYGKSREFGPLLGEYEEVLDGFPHDPACHKDGPEILAKIFRAIV